MTAPYYDPYDYEVDARAHAVWKRLRDEAPLYRNDELDFYALSRYDDVLRAIVDTRTFSSARGNVLEMMTGQLYPLGPLVFKDPPDHSRYRKLVSRAFTTRTIARLEDRLERLCNTLLDRVAGRNAFDFLDDYGAIIPPTMILALLGFPEGLEDEWRHGVDQMFHQEEGERGFAGDEGADLSRGLAATGSFVDGLFERLPDLLEQRRRDPQDDLLSVLVDTQLEDGDTSRGLTTEEIRMLVMELSVAGTETVARLLGWVAVLLDRHPDQRRLLVERPELIPNAIEECLRYEAPSPVQARWVTEDVELHGQTVPAGSRILLLNASGNRDERHFPDADRLDVERSIDRHLSFGYGAHFCVGAALARLEAQVALRELLRRHPHWSVDHDRTEMVHTSTVRGYAKVPVTI